MCEPEAFWDLDGDESANSALTEFALRAAEQALGVKLPEAYIALLRIKNGGYSRRFVFPTAIRTSWAEDHVPLDELFGIGSTSDKAGHQSILCTPYMTREWGLPPKQVLLAGAGDWWITLDYRRGSDPQVSWIDVETDQDIVLAKSFEEFMSRLLPAEVADSETFRIRAAS